MSNLHLGPGWIFTDPDETQPIDGFDHTKKAGTSFD